MAHKPVHVIIHRFAAEVALVLVIVATAIAAEMVRMNSLDLMKLAVDFSHAVSRALADVTAAEVLVVAVLKMFGAAEV